MYIYMIWLDVSHRCVMCLMNSARDTLSTENFVKLFFA